MTCNHFQQLYALPKSSQAIHKEECTRCFVNQDSENGIFVSLHDFNGYCSDHMKLFIDASHPIALNIKRTPKHDTEAPPPPKKLAIEASNEKDQYRFETMLHCHICHVDAAVESSSLQSVVNKILDSDSFTHQAEVKAWQEELTGCEHSVSVSETQQKGIKVTGQSTCSACQLAQNLWMCLTCGNVACGRAQFGGVGGNGHALSHYEQCGHAVAVKLGTITAEGTADVYCYACNEERINPNLASDLASFGIHVQNLQKTEKSMTELQLEHNLKYDFESTNADGEEMKPVHGPGLTGLTNLGNSCYMASVLQVLFSVEKFSEAWQKLYNQNRTCAEPAKDLNIQMAKVQDGLNSGRFAVPREDQYQEGIRPYMFKHLIGANHQEFSSMRQQDAEEFLVYLLEKVRAASATDDPSDIFSFELQNRLQCTECHGVRYKSETQEVISVPVPAKQLASESEEPKFEAVGLTECFDQLTRTEQVDYKCPKCQRNVLAQKRQTFSTLPDMLFVHGQRFQHVNWVPTKVDVPVQFAIEGQIDLRDYVSAGLQPDEVELVEADNAPSFNPETLTNLQGMGFTEIQAKNALLKVGDDASACLEWIFANQEQSLQPIQFNNSKSVDQESLAMLESMGYPQEQARKALEMNSDLESALNWLLDPPALTETPAHRQYGSTTPTTYTLKAFISHRGPSTHTGHYVAHIRKEIDGKPQWILFNDARVLLVNQGSIQEAAEQAYVWLFERIVN